MIPQRRALSGIMTLADLNNCAALRRKHGMDLDLVEFKNLARWSEVGTRPDSNNVSGLVFVFVVVVVCFYLFIFFVHGVTVALSDLPKLFHGLILSL